MTEIKYSYVYVVCGDDEIIDELNFSVRSLKQFSKIPALVVTDLNRNTKKIECGNIIHVDTPVGFTDHEASIYLKTGLAEILEMNRIYCYLDTDVIAVNADVDNIFSYRKGVINFASDIVDLRRFSNYAVKCGCLERNSRKIDALRLHVSEYERKLSEWQVLHKKRLEIIQYLDSLIEYWDNHYKIKDDALLQKKKKLEELIPYWDDNYRIKDEALLQKKEYLESIIAEWDLLYKEKANSIDSMIKEWEVKHKITDSVLIEKRENLLKLLPVTRKDLLKYIRRSMTLVLKYRRNKKENIWYDRQGNKLYDEYNEFDNYFRRKGYIWEEASGKWMTLDGELYFDKRNEFFSFFNERGFTWKGEDEIWFDKEGNRIIDKKNEFYRFFDRNGYYWVPDKKIWYDSDHNVMIDEENEFVNYFKKRGFTWAENTGKWFDEEGIDVFDDEDYFGFSNFFKRELDFEFLPPEGVDFEKDNSLHYYAYTKNKIGLSWDESAGTWLDENNKDILITRCNHLQQAAMEKFGIDITDPHWVHFNGGVFLFDKNSVEFMKTWKDFTLEIFKEEYWKTRDQGTLAVVTWKFGLQYEDRIPEEFNFIVSKDRLGITHLKGLHFLRDNSDIVICPGFIHLLSNFGNSLSTVWEEIESLINK